jgi:hypothetical protein
MFHTTDKIVEECSPKVLFFHNALIEQEEGKGVADSMVLR